MARGGARVGAGRPKGSRSNPDITKDLKGVRKQAKKAGMSPLEYMLAVMNNPEADQVRRDRMAVAAAPYVHEKAADTAPGKKEARMAEAAAAAVDKFAPPPPPKLVVDNG